MSRESANEYKIIDAINGEVWTVTMYEIDILGTYGEVEWYVLPCFYIIRDWITYINYYRYVSHSFLLR